MALLISAILLGPFGLNLLYRALVGHKRAGWRCYRCRFDLRASRTLARCPECGAPIVASGSRPPITIRQRAGYATIALALLLPGIALVIEASPLLLESRLIAWLAPDVVTARAMARPDPQAYGIAAATLRNYATGLASDRLMRAAVRAALARLAADETTPQSLVPTRLMTGSVGTESLRALAEVLDNPELSESRFDALLRTIARNYSSLDLTHTSAVDDVLADLVLGARLDLMNRRGGSASTPPRTLTPQQHELLLDTILDIQADGDRRWNQSWGIAIERANAAGRIDAARIARYVDQCFAPQIVILDQPGLLAGDLVEFAVVPQWRLGTGPPVFLAARPVGDAWQGRVTGSVRYGEVTGANFGGHFSGRGLLALPDAPGKHTLELDVVVRIGRDVHDALKAHVNPFDHNGDSPVWLALPGRTVVKRARLELDLLPSNAPRVTRSASGISPAQVRDAIGRSWVHASPDGEPPALDVTLGLRGLAIPFAATVSARQGELECPLGWAFLTPANFRGTSLTGPTPGLDPAQPFELVLRADTGPLERPSWWPIVWDGETVIPVRHVTRAPVILDGAQQRESR